MRYTSFFVMKLAGCLITGSAIITSVVFPTLFTFIMGCTAWIIIITSMVYNEIKYRKKAFRSYITQSKASADGYLFTRIPPQRDSKIGLIDNPDALIQEENFENSLSHF